MSENEQLRCCLEKWLAQAKCEDDLALLAETVRALGYEMPSVRECLERWCFKYPEPCCLVDDTRQALAADCINHDKEYYMTGVRLARAILGEEEE